MEPLAESGQSAVNVLPPANIHSHPHPHPHSAGASPLAHSSHWLAGAQRHQVRLRHRWSQGGRGVTAVQTLCTVVAPNLSGYDCRIYYGVIRTKTALHTVPGGRRVTTGQKAPSGPAPGLKAHRFALIQCEFQILCSSFFKQKNWNCTKVFKRQKWWILNVQYFLSQFIILVLLYLEFCVFLTFHT